jgi:hypothetical protein
MFETKPRLIAGDYLHAHGIVWCIEMLSSDGCWGWCDSETHGVNKFMILPVVDINNQQTKGYKIKIGDFDVQPLTEFEYLMMKICPTISAKN